MEEKKLTPEEIEVLKAAKTLKVYCTDRDCNKCMFERDGVLTGRAKLPPGHCFFEDVCPEFWDVEELPEDPRE